MLILKTLGLLLDATENPRGNVGGPSAEHSPVLTAEHLQANAWEGWYDAGQEPAAGSTRSLPRS